MKTIDDKTPKPNCMNTGKNRYNGICKSCDGTYKTAKKISCDYYFSKAKHQRINRQYQERILKGIREFNDLPWWEL